MKGSSGSDSRSDSNSKATGQVQDKSSSFLPQISNENRMLFVILVIAFTQGVVTLADLSVQYLYKDDYHMSPAQVSIASGISSLPWIIKPVWGMISDNIPLLGYRRKSYLLILGLIGAFSWFGLSTFAGNPIVGIVLLLIGAISVSFNSVIGEALIVESAQNNNGRAEMTEEDKQAEASNNVSFFFGIKSVGILITSYTGGWLLGYTSKYTIFYITMIFPLVAGLSSWLLPEKRVSKEPHARRLPQREDNGIEIVANSAQYESFEVVTNLEAPQPNTSGESNNLIQGQGMANTSSSEESSIPDVATNWAKIMNFMKNPAIYKPVIFIFIFCMTPSTGSAMFFYYTNELGFSTEFMGEIQLASALASIVGIWIFNRFFKNTPFTKIFIWSGIICTLANLSQIALVTGWSRDLGISDKFFCLTGNLLIQVFAELNIIPILVLSCRICPKNVEGTMYALLMSILNFGSMISNEWGAFNTWALGITETNFDNLWLLIFIASMATIAPLPFIGIIDFNKAIELNESENAATAVVLTQEERTLQETVAEKKEEMLEENSKSTVYESI